LFDAPPLEDDWSVEVVLVVVVAVVAVVTAAAAGEAPVGTVSGGVLSVSFALVLLPPQAEMPTASATPSASAAIVGSS
jgi:hypothetical protein